MRTIETEQMIRNIKEMCIEANHFLSADMERAMKCAAQTEEAPLGRQILGQLQDNLEIAGKDMIPICHKRMLYPDRKLEPIKVSTFFTELTSLLYPAAPFHVDGRGSNKL